MKEIESIISPLVKTQFPEFYTTEGPRFIDFVKQYYVWMETQNQALNASRNLFNYRDIDKTSPDFVSHFKQKYLNGFPLSTEANTQLLAKHSLDMYAVKGTTRGIQTSMRALFNEDSSVFYPGENLLKSSDGTWVQPVYLELSVSSRTKDFIGKEIVGSVSGAKAFMESLVKKRVSGKILEVAYLSGLRGDFQLNEFITTSANTVLDSAPRVIGSMTNLTIVNGGANFAVGDVFDVVSSNGKQGKARVTSVSNETGKVFFTYIDALHSGGWGYSIEHSNVIIASKTLQVANVTNANTLVTGFEIFENIKQQLANVAYTIARPNNANFTTGAVIENYYANGVVAANATIVAVNPTDDTSGYIVVTPNVGNVATVDVTFAIRDAVGTQATFNANSGVANSTEYITTTSAHTFVNNDIVVYLVATGNTVLSGLSVGAAYCIVNANTTAFQLADSANGTPINITAGVNESGHILKKSLGSGVISTYTDRTANGTLMGSNSTHIGLTDITSPFIVTPYVTIRGAVTNTTAIVANTSQGTGAHFNIGLLTDTETVLLTPDFLHSNNTQNVVFSSINLNGNNSGAFLQFGANVNNESTFNAYSGVSNTTDVITTTLAHSFANNDSVVYSVAPGNTAVTGLVAGTTYYVVNTDPGHSSLQLANTVGGAAINITSGSAESGHYIRLQTGTFAFNANSGVSNTTSYITTIAAHTFQNSSPVVYRLSEGNTAVTGLSNNSTYFVANTNGTVSFQLSTTRFPHAPKFNASTGVDGSGDYITPIVNTATFNANSGVANTTDYITTAAAHNFVNGDIVVYTVSTGNTALTNLTNGFSYFVRSANTTAFQLATTEKSTNINLTAGANETGHTFTRYHGLVNTNVVRYVTSTGNTAISGLTNNQLYYVVNANTTAFQLAADYYYDYANIKVYNVANIATGTNEQGHTLTTVIPVQAGTNETGHTLYGAHHDLSTTDGTFGGFGFVKFPLSTMDAVLIDCLRFDSTVIGSIATITSRNTGQDYNIDPFVTVVDPWVFGYYKHDYLMNITPLTGAFVVGEQIQQSYLTPGITLTVNNFSGTAANGVATSTVIINEKIYQSYANGAERAYGFVVEGALSGGSGTIKLSGIVGSFVNTSNSSTQMKSLSSGGTANVSLVDVVTLTTTARAIVKEASNTSFLKLKRINLENTFAAGNTIIGEVSGATAIVESIDQDFTVPAVGINANITANVQTANAVAKTIAVYDSGFGYYDQETVTLSKPNSDYEITAIVQLAKQGVGSGFYTSTRGFLDSDKKLHDNDYYQEYSYEVVSKIPFDKYVDVLKQVAHVAGTKMFGRVEAASVVNSDMTVINSIVIS